MSRTRAHILSILAVGLITLPMLAQTASQPDPKTLPYMNPALPIEQRVNDLIGRMTPGRESFADARPRRRRSRAWASRNTTGGTKACTVSPSLDTPRISRR